MKLNKLLVLISTMALMACATATTSGVPLDDSSSLESSDTSSSNENTTPSDTSSANTPSTSTTNSQSSNAGSTNSTFVSPDSLRKKTVNFYNGGFTSTSLDQSKSQADFVDWFNGDDNVLKSIEYTGLVQMNYIGNQNESTRFSTMIIGSQNSDGKLKFNFNYAINSVKIVTQPYTKYISYNDTYNNDLNSVLLIDNTEYDLSLESNYSGPTENKTFEKTFGNNIRSFSLANKEACQRVFIHSMEITYIV